MNESKFWSAVCSLSKFWCTYFTCEERTLCMFYKPCSRERLNHCDSNAGRLAWITGSWVTSDCKFKHSATVNQKRVCSSLCERRQNSEILPNSNNYLFKRAIQSLLLVTGCQILNMFKVNRWLLRLLNSITTTSSCVFTRATVLLAFLQRWNFGNSVAHVNWPLHVKSRWIIIFMPRADVSHLYHLQINSRVFKDDEYKTKANNNCRLCVHPLFISTLLFACKEHAHSPLFACWVRVCASMCTHTHTHTHTRTHTHTPIRSFSTKSGPEFSYTLYWNVWAINI